MLDSPCHNCSDRVAGCHATCEKYKEFQRELQEMKDKERGEKDFIGYAVQSNLRKRDKYLKRKHSRKRK